MRRLWFVFAFLFSFLVVSSSQAVLPVLVYAVARQAVVMTAESVAIGVIAKGFAANDPYVRTTATIPRSTLARNLTKIRGPRWAGVLALLATVAAYGWDYDDQVGFYIPVKTLPTGGVCVTDTSVFSAADCLASGVKRTGRTGYALPETKVDCSNISGACPNVVMQAAWCSVPASVTTSCNGYITVAIYRYIQANEEVFKQPVTEQDVNDKLLPAIVASPNTIGDMFAGATQKQLETLLDGATVPYNATDPTPEMAQLKSDYRNGLLQAVDPNAAHYVTPEQLKQIQDMVAAEDAANTDDGAVEALNEKMKQPITQAQYEESNLKTETAQASALSTSLAPAFDPFNQLQLDHDFIIDKVNTPSEPPDSLSFFQWSLPTGSCSGFNVDMSVGQGKLHASKTVNEHCPFYNEVAHPLLFWFLNILTFLYVWWIWDRSVSDMAR